MKEYVQIPSFRNLLLLATITVVAINTNFCLRTTKLIYSISDFEDRMLNSFEASLIPTFSKKTKPFLVLHVGPGAVGSNSIPATLTKDWSEEVLRSDQYKFIGNDAMKRSRSYHCSTNITEGCNRTLSSELIELLEKEDQHLVGSNILLGDLDQERRRAWVDATKGKRNVSVVVDYVRLYELLPSRYSQHYQKSNMKAGLQNWPGIQGSYKTPSFSKYLAQTADLNDHESVRAYNAWGNDLPVSIFNVHQEGDLVTNFVCQVIKGANHTCQRLTNRPEIPKKCSNSGSPMFPDYDILAVHAYEQGLVHESDNRLELSQAIWEHHKKEKDDLPRKCPDKKALKKLYDASKKFESWALGFGASKPVTDFDASWNMALNTKKLCGVDPKAAIERDVWRSFFRLRYVRTSAQVFYG